MITLNTSLLHLNSHMPVNCGHLLSPRTHIRVSGGHTCRARGAVFRIFAPVQSQSPLGACEMLVAADTL
jgi:hypothetical protein